MVPSGRFSASKGKLVAKILLLAVFGISSVIVELKFGHTLFIYLFFTVLCLYDVDSDVVLKAFVAVIGTMLATTAVCSLAGVTENYLYPTTGLFRHGYLRSSYGIGSN